MVAFSITFPISSTLIGFFQLFHASWINFGNLYLTKHYPCVFQMCCQGAACRVFLQSLLIPPRSPSPHSYYLCFALPFPQGDESLFYWPLQIATGFIYPLRFVFCFINFNFHLRYLFTPPPCLFKLFFFWFLTMHTQMPSFAICCNNEGSFPVLGDIPCLGDPQYLDFFFFNKEQERKTPQMKF